MILFPVRYGAPETSFAITFVPFLKSRGQKIVQKDWELRKNYPPPVKKIGNFFP
jgi:hypothetical protein